MDYETQNRNTLKNTVRIVHTGIQVPPFTSTTSEILPYADMWLQDEPERFRRKAIKIFENAGVDRRYGIIPVQEVFSPGNFEENNRIYMESAKTLGKEVLQKTLSEAGWDPQSLDFLITVSCTGFMIPSLDAYLANTLHLSTSLVRLPVTEMGCAAGISGLIYAREFLKETKGKRGAVVSFEAPSVTFQYQDHSMANIVSAAIFGDGAACVLLSSEEDAEGPEILKGGMYHYRDTTHLMGFDLTNSGLKMVLDPEVPDTIARDFREVIVPFLSENETSLEAIDHMIFHPGGRKIVSAVHDLIVPLGKNITTTQRILSSYGNMSSATVLYVLHDILAGKPRSGEKGLMLSFGPGFSAQRILLQW